MVGVSTNTSLGEPVSEPEELIFQGQFLAHNHGHVLSPFRGANVETDMSNLRALNHAFDDLSRRHSPSRMSSIVVYR